MKIAIMTLIIGISLGCLAGTALPEQFKALPKEQYHDFRAETFSLHKAGELCFLEDDATATAGKTVRMPGGHKVWALQCVIPENAVNGERWKVYLSVKCESDGQDGDAFQVGLHNAKEKRTIFAKTYSSISGEGGTYKLLEVGTFALKPGMLFWVCPQANPKVKNIRVDRIFIVKEQK